MLTNLNLADNQLCGVGKFGGGTYDATGITALAETLKVNAVLTNLCLAWNQLCGVDLNGNGTYDATGIKALAKDEFRCMLVIAPRESSRPPPGS